jgi:hypothetical protein
MMIKKAKDILQAVILQRVPGITIVRNMAEEQHTIMTRQWPLVSLITNPGRFDDREAKTIRYPDAQAGIWKERYVRGKRTLPILLRCFAEGEDAADALFSCILPAIPRKWELDEFEGLIVINGEEHSDFVDNVNKLYLSVAEIAFSVPVALDETEVPTITSVEAEPEMNKA